MNITTVNRLRITSGYLDEIIEEARHLVHSTHFQGFTETAFYRPKTDLQEFYTLSVWKNLQSLPNPQESKSSPGFKSLFNKVELVEGYVFQLRWEYRLVDKIPQASCIFLVTFPDKFPKEQLETDLIFYRQQIHQAPGLLGAWVGFQIKTEKCSYLIRSDWSTTRYGQNFYALPQMQELVNRLQASGVTAKYAAFNRQTVFTPDPPEKPITQSPEKATLSTLGV
jgi:heme-degrading monooxygenase HmoA